MRDLVRLRISAWVEIRDEATLRVAFDLVETTARDLQLKLMLLADTLASVQMSTKQGRAEEVVTPLSGDSLPEFFNKDDEK